MSALKSYKQSNPDLVCNLFRDKSSFTVKGIDEDVVKLRYKHHRDRLLDTINRVLDERHKVKE